MKHTFACSLCRGGILGGGLYLDEDAVVYRTNKLTVDKKYRNLVLPHREIRALTWKSPLLPLAAFEMTDGETYTFLIFGRKRFVRCFDAVRQDGKTE